MSLEEVARGTRIRIETLESLESDRFEDLPAEVFVRGFLRAYARAVSISVDETMARYTLSRRAAWVVAPLTATLPGRKPTRRSRLGVAIGFVALLILFTIALSLALMPRGRRLPSELACIEQREQPVRIV